MRYRVVSNGTAHHSLTRTGLSDRLSPIFNRGRSSTMAMSFGSGTANSYEWRLGQRVFAVTRTNPCLDTLTFDGRNQRIQHALRTAGRDPVTADQTMIRDALGSVEHDHINKLYWQIAEAGGLVSPLVIDPMGVVYEGNCRLAADNAFVRITLSIRGSAPLPVRSFQGTSMRRPDCCSWAIVMSRGNKNGMHRRSRLHDGDSAQQVT